MHQRPLVLVTPGEPGGIGPDLVLSQAFSELRSAINADVVLVADPAMLLDRAECLGADVSITEVDSPQMLERTRAQGTLAVCPVRLGGIARPGIADPAHAHYVLATLDTAQHWLARTPGSALVTGPIQKSAIIASGIPASAGFSGHTDYLAAPHQRRPVMMLAGPSLRVALVTVHLPLRAVADALRGEDVLHTIRTVAGDLRTRFGVTTPRLCVTGLNPHAGEAGHLGQEDQAIIAPAIEAARADGLDVTGPLPADTAFSPTNRARFDAFVAMYHDQGLTVVKALDFGDVVNITLGLPIIRTSVDHGTALDLAGSGRANPHSLCVATRLAAKLAQQALSGGA